MSRLEERMQERLTGIRKSQSVVLGAVAAIVLMRLATYALSTYFLLLDDLVAFRAVQVVGTAFAAVLDILILVLVWVLFQTVARIDRESERLQAFMDNVYRKMLAR